MLLDEARLGAREARVESDEEEVFPEDLAPEEERDVAIADAARAGEGEEAIADQREVVLEGDQEAQAETGKLHYLLFYEEESNFSFFILQKIWWWWWW